MSRPRYGLRRTPGLRRCQRVRCPTIEKRRHAERGIACEPLRVLDPLRLRPDLAELSAGDVGDHRAVRKRPALAPAQWPRALALTLLLAGADAQAADEQAADKPSADATKAGQWKLTLGHCRLSGAADKLLERTDANLRPQRKPELGPQRRADLGAGLAARRRLPGQR